VLARHFLIEGATGDAGMQKQLWALAAELVPDGNAGDFNQAMMELGATVCTPRAPGCLVCPIRASCGAHKAGVAERYPAPKVKRAPRVVDMVALMLERGDEILLARRPPAGLWGGLWEPPTGELRPTEPPASAARRVAKECTGLRLRNIQDVTRFEHVLSHRRMRFHVLRADATGRLRLEGYDAARWTNRQNARELGVAAWTSRLFDHFTKRGRSRA
jgi:A/G-specific adenine glycosylase